MLFGKTSNNLNERFTLQELMALNAHRNHFIEFKFPALPGV
jgi:hypothetical protein